MSNADKTSRTASAVSRRRFIRSAALGAAWAKIKGTITLDALMLTYFGQVINSTEPITWIFTPKYHSTFAFEAVADPALRLRPRPPDAEGVFLGNPFTQSVSQGLARGIVLRNRARFHCR